MADERDVLAEMRDPQLHEVLDSAAAFLHRQGVAEGSAGVDAARRLLGQAAAVSPPGAEGEREIEAAVEAVAQALAEYFDYPLKGGEFYDEDYWLALAWKCLVAARSTQPEERLCTCGHRADAHVNRESCWGTTRCPCMAFKPEGFMPVSEHEAALAALSPPEAEEPNKTHVAASVLTDNETASAVASEAEGEREPSVEAIRAAEIGLNAAYDANGGSLMNGQVVAAVLYSAYAVDFSARSPEPSEGEGGEG